MSEYSRQIASGKDNFERIARESSNKANGSILMLSVKAIMGGWLVSLGGYASLVIASLFYEPNTKNASARVAFAMVFPSALLAIMFTGSDLYTGNTMCFTFGLFSRKISPQTYLLKLIISIVGNYIGTSLGALILVGGVGHFLKGYGPGADYLTALARSKTNLPFWRLMFSAMGCNSFVCLAVWTFFASYDAAGAWLNVFAQIGAFAAGGLEHLIANFFVLNAALVSNSGVTFMDVYVHNFIPVWLGNSIAGIILIGTPLSILYNERPKAETFDVSDKLESQDIIIH